MPMPINNVDEYDKVVHVSWFTPDRTRDELRYIVCGIIFLLITSKTYQVSMCSTILTNVSVMLHRYSKLLKPILLLFRRSFSKSSGHRRYFESGNSSPGMHCCGFC